MQMLLQMFQSRDFLTPSSFLHIPVSVPLLAHIISTSAFCNVNYTPEAYLQRPKLFLDLKKSTFLDSEKFVGIKSQRQMLNTPCKNPSKPLSKFFQKLETINQNKNKQTKTSPKNNIGLFDWENDTYQIKNRVFSFDS